jgi:L-aminopeptidase/D-esterase-like protein
MSDDRMTVGDSFRYMGGLTDIRGILVGHATNLEALTGCTVILCEQGAVPGVSIPGSATGTEEVELLKPGHVTDRIHAICFAGGSAFGLEAASGVRRFLDHKGVGFPTPGGPVPLVTGAILYDLGRGKGGFRPNREMGESAAAAATGGPVVEGAVGAGTGATVGKLFGPDRMMKSGVGTASMEISGGVKVAALAVVNALGDVIDPKTGRVIAGARVSKEGREFANSAEAMLGGVSGGIKKENTTLVCVATNAAFDRVQMSKIAQLATIGMARSISPVFTMSDGDIVISLSIGDRKAHLDVVGVAAAQVVAQAIVRAVKMAPTIDGIPGLAS